MFPGYKRFKSGIKKGAKLRHDELEKRFPALASISAASHGILVERAEYPHSDSMKVATSMFSKMITSGSVLDLLPDFHEDMQISCFIWEGEAKTEFGK